MGGGVGGVGSVLASRLALLGGGGRDDICFSMEKSVVLLWFCGFLSRQKKKKEKKKIKIPIELPGIYTWYYTWYQYHSTGYTGTWPGLDCTVPVIYQVYHHGTTCIYYTKTLEMW